MNTNEAFAFMLSFRKDIIAERLGMQEKGVEHLKWRFSKNLIKEPQLMGYLIQFGFPVNIQWGLPKGKNHAKKV